MKTKTVILVTLLTIGLPLVAQEKIIVTTGKMGPFKLEMKKQQVEKIINQKIVLKVNNDDYNNETQVVYKDYVFTMSFYNTSDNNPDSFRLAAISTKDVRIKTPSDLGIGNSKLDLFNAYSDKYDIGLYSPFVENKLTKKYEKQPGIRKFHITDYDLSTDLTFVLTNGFITEISLTEASED